MHAKDGVVWVLLGVDGYSHQVVVEAEDELEALDAAILALSAAREHLRRLTGAGK